MTDEKTNVMRLLDGKRVKYNAYTYPCPDGAVSGTEVARLTGLPEERVFKTLVTVGKSGICGMNYLVASTIVNSNVESLCEMCRFFFKLIYFVSKVYIKAVLIAYNSKAHFSFYKVVTAFVKIERKQAHYSLYLCGWSLPVFRGKSIKRNGFDSPIKAGVCHSFKNSNSHLMSLGAIHTAHFCPTSVSVHNKGYVL